MVKDILLVGLGGCAGSVGRYLLSRYIELRFLAPFPVETFAVNIIGCFVMGLFYGLSIKATGPTDIQRLFATGVCGGFTTFSSFSLDSLRLLQNGQTGLAFAYIASSLLAGLAAVWIGLLIIKAF